MRVSGCRFRVQGSGFEYLIWENCPKYGESNGKEHGT